MGYIKEVFDVSSLEQAANVVLSFDPQDPLKFFNETQFLVDEIEKSGVIHKNSLVLDFGCGMGRVSRELIGRFECEVIGVDISPSMLSFAESFVENPEKFSTFQSYDKEESVDVCLSSFVLQHVEHPKASIDTIYKVLRPGGILIVLNEHKRFVPSSIDRQNYIVWEDDHFDVFKSLESKFTKINTKKYLNEKLNIIFYQKKIS